MRVAAIYDIHANLPALEAVLQEIARLQVDQIVVGGDVLPGPMPRETMELLLALELPARFIYGNGEVAVLQALEGRAMETVPEQYQPVVRWNAQQLDRRHGAILASWPATIRLDVSGVGDVLFCHATPRNDNEIFTRLTPDERLAPMFTGVTAEVVVCGHTHMQFDRRFGSMRIVNAGSVGMPFGEPGADWLLLGPGIDLRHTVYDLARAAEKIRASPYPQANDFAENNVLRPPSEAQMLELFTRASK